MQQTDVLVLGSGLAGCTAAWTLAKEGLQVTMISSAAEAWQSDSFAEHEGIAYIGQGDTADRFASDLTTAAGGQCCNRAVDQLATMGTRCVEGLLFEELGVDFDRSPSGNYLLAQDSGHSAARVLRCGDGTGRAIVEALLAKLRGSDNVTILDNHTAVDLITLARHSLRGGDAYKKPTCAGAYVLNNRTLQVEPFLAKETILATGSWGQVFLHTTNDGTARGDGIAMATRAGARTMNLHKMQFHPMAFYAPNSAPYALAESLRFKGGEMLSHKGTSFMERYHAQGSAAPRNVVARAAYTEMVDNNADHLWLDMTRADTAWLQEQYPQLWRHCGDKGFDIAKDLLPVVPAAHCCNGGVAVDRAGQTTVKRLRAIGEVACTGVHGDERMPSVSLLERVVWGVACAEGVTKEVTKFAYYFPEVAPWSVREKGGDATLVQQDWLSVKQAMWNYVGLVHDNARLRRALGQLHDLRWEVDARYREAQLTPDLVGLHNGVTTACLVAQAAIG